jgi:hypothetical protein
MAAAAIEFEIVGKASTLMGAFPFDSSLSSPLHLFKIYESAR